MKNLENHFAIFSDLSCFSTEAENCLFSEMKNPFTISLLSNQGRESMKKKRKLCGRILLCSAVLAVISFHIVKACAPYREQEIWFSVEECFCTQDEKLELSTLLDSEIYYTEDGSIPTREATKYTEPILLKAGEETKAVTIRAIACYADGSTSEICTRTYFMGKQGTDRFSTMIVAVTSDPYNLFDYENGILVSGWLRDEYALANPGKEFTDRAPANYNLRGDISEREAYVEIWEADGTKVVEQDLGIRVHGGVSRGSDIKSLRLIARDEYGNSRICYELFPGESSTAAGTEITQYKRVILRNHGNDQEKGYLRNELGERLVADAGFRDTQACRAVAVYLNGEYYGFSWMQEYYDEAYLHTNYGTDKDQGSWQILTPHKGNASTGSGEEADIQAVLDLNAMYSYCGRDLQDDAVFEELAEQLDIENFLQYCAIEIYLANPDWPNNNCKAYRWYSKNGDYANPYADGKWRYFLYDLDVGMARTGSSVAGNLTLGETLGCVESNWDRTSPLLKAILRREDMQERFCEIMEELMEGAFSYEHACSMIDGMQQEMEAELEFHMQKLAREQAEKEGTSMEEAYAALREVHEEEIEKIKEFFLCRPAIMQEELEKLPEYAES